MDYKHQSGKSDKNYFIAGAVICLVLLLGMLLVKNCSAKEPDKKIEKEAPVTTENLDMEKSPVSWYLEKAELTRRSIGEKTRVDLDAKPEIYKTWASKVSVPLSRPALKDGPSFYDMVKSRGQGNHHPLPKAMTKDDLATLLFIATGITEPKRELRAAPSAGALFPVETYVLVNNVIGLSKGLYHYDIEHHTLAYVIDRDDLTPKIESAVDRGVLVKRSAATLIFTTIFFRTVWKYGDRGYLYSLVDAGCVLENAMLASAAMEFRAEAFYRFDDDRLGELLRLDQNEEGVIAVAAVGIAGSKTSSDEAKPSPNFKPWTKGLKGGRAGPVIDLFHGATYLKRITTETHPVKTMLKKDKAGANLPGAILLREKTLSTLPLPLTIQTRRSVRRYTGAGVSLKKFSAFMKMGGGFSFGPDDPVSVYVAISNVHDLEKGIYKYIPKSHSLVPIYIGHVQEKIGTASLSQKAALTCAFQVILSIPIKELEEKRGARGLRYGAIMIGRTTERIYLAANSLGLGSVGIGAFFDKEMAALVGLENEREAVIMTLAIGVKE